MKLFLPCLHLLLFLSLTATSLANPKYAKTGCNDTCGNVTIPYPFEIGADCSVNKWYIVDCNSSTPYLPALKHLEVLSVNLKNLTVTVSVPRITDCQNPVRYSSSVDLGGSPFLFSKRHNKFVFKGCGIAVMMDHGSVVAGCSTACPGVTVNNSNNCFGIGCCQTTIPYYIKSYNINITVLEDEDGDCGSAFLVDEALDGQGRLSKPFIVKKTSFLPLSLRWTLAHSDQLMCCDNETPKRRKVDMFDGTLVDTWECKHYLISGYLGNPYLVDGCKYDYGEPTKECKRCKDNRGSCAKGTIYNVEGDFFSQNFTCHYHFDLISPCVYAG